MIKLIIDKVEIDLRESRINWKLAFSILPIGFFTYFFHEFGHWTFGELMGNDMTLSLNNSSPQNGYFISESGALWSAIGGPVFTILQALIFLILTQITRSIYTHLVVFFGVFSRFFSIIFGGISLQDEGRIATMLGINAYLVAMFVLTLLFLILWKSHRIMKLNLKAVGYFTTLSVFVVLLIIGIYELML